MPIRNVTQKRKGKAKTRKSSIPMTRAIRCMRAAFFILIGILVVFFYFSYENGSLVEGLKSMNLSGYFQAGVNYVQENPLKVAFFLGSNLVLFGAGYLIGIKRR